MAEEKKTTTKKTTTTKTTAPKKEVVKKETKTATVKKETVKAQASTKAKAVVADNSGYEFKKPLTEREQMVFNYFLNNKDTVVFAKDLAQLLQIPRDYVYKYIKNLRNKIEGDKLKNVPSGGFVLTE